MIPLQTSNYAGTNGIYLNPSSMADSRIGWQVSPGLGSLAFSRQPLAVPVVPFGNKLFSAGDPRGVNWGEVRGPSIMAQFGRRRHAVGLTTRYRAGYALSGNYELVRWINGSNRTAPAGPQSFSFATEGYTEYALSYAVSLLDLGPHHLKAGGTVKSLRGLQQIDLQGQATFGAGTSVVAPYTGAAITGSTTDVAFFEGASMGRKLAGTALGRGAGFDVGAAYEFRPKQRFYRYHMDGKLRAAEEMNKYLFRLGFSLLDVGQIRYNQITQYASTGRAGTLRRADFADKNTTELQTQFVSQFGLAQGAEVRSQTIDLPRTTSVQLDVYLGRSWYGNVVYQTAMPITTNAGLYRGRVVAFGPRSEGPGGELAGTIYYYPDLQKTAIGLHVKAGIFIIGTDNLLGNFRDNGLPPHLYAGLSIPFNARRPKDRDKDEVSDKMDRCPDVAGILPFEGCPDTDGDGLEDAADTCPTVAGPKALRGCPDTDKDGVLDKDDACPTQFGPARLSGCPDADADGVSDNLDQCPTIVGRPDMAGCPDTDSDGTPDHLDLCQSEKGLKEANGCLLRNRTALPDTLNPADVQLLTQLGRAFVQGPRLDTQLVNTLKARLITQPNRRLAIMFTGPANGSLPKIEQWFREELDRTGVPAEIKAVVKPGQETGFALTIETR